MMGLPREWLPVIQFCLFLGLRGHGGTHGTHMAPPVMAVDNPFSTGRVSSGEWKPQGKPQVASKTLWLVFVGGTV